MRHGPSDVTLHKVSPQRSLMHEGSMRLRRLSLPPSGLIIAGSVIFDDNADLFIPGGDILDSDGNSRIRIGTSSPHLIFTGNVAMASNLTEILAAPAGIVVNSQTTGVMIGASGLPANDGKLELNYGTGSFSAVPTAIIVTGTPSLSGNEAAVSILQMSLNLDLAGFDITASFFGFTAQPIVRSTSSGSVVTLVDTYRAAPVFTGTAANLDITEANSFAARPLNASGVDVTDLRDFYGVYVGHAQIVTYVRFKGETITAGTNKFQMQLGDNPSYINGPLALGSTDTATEALEVTGDAIIDSREVHRYAYSVG